jgi:hypothetical protein
VAGHHHRGAGRHLRAVRVDGITNLVLGVTRSSARDRPSWALIVEGLVGIAAGVLTFLWPQITLLALVLSIGAWAVVTGVFEIVAAIRLRRVVTGEGLLLRSGVLSIVFGIFVFLFRGAGAISDLLGSASQCRGNRHHPRGARHPASSRTLVIG